jgi:hypothetical protein
MKSCLSFSRMVQLKRPMAFKQLAAVCVMASSATLAFAAPGNSADELLKDASQILQQLDASHYGALWQDAAPFVKSSLSQDQFASQMQQARKSVGAVASRNWGSVTRLTYSGAKGIPDGFYANVDIATALTSGQTIFEQVSFRLGDGGKWQLTGYVPHPIPVAAAQTLAPKP